MRVPRRFRRSGKIGHAICIAGLQVPLAHRHGGGACARETVRWYKDNQKWWREIAELPSYKDFIASFYGKYLGDDL